MFSIKLIDDIYDGDWDFIYLVVYHMNYVCAFVRGKVIAPTKVI